jgi:PAT family beta-lactamase induction signal transducer AmpG
MTRSPRPWHFFVLVLPYGASFGFVSVAFPFIARQRGIAVDAIAAVVAAAFLPHAPKFLWAPVVDVTWSRKGWYLASLALVSAGTFASMAMPIAAPSLHALTAVIVASQVGLTLMGMAIEGLIGRSVAPERKRMAAGWFQAGMFVGVGLGGGAAIKLVARFGGPAAGALIALALGACALPVLLFDEAPSDEARDRDGWRAAVRGLGRDLAELVRSRGAIAALVLCASPIGAGAASNLFGAIADEWHASLDLVAWTTGAFGNAVSAIGAAGGGWIAARTSPRAAYGLAGALTAATGVAMAFAPHTPWAYGVFTLVYQGCNGVAFAGFSALAFEIAGKGAVATKYNVLASLANVAIAYTTRVDGAAHAPWGGRGVLVVDAAMTCAGLGILAVVVAGARARTGTRYP